MESKKEYRRYHPKKRCNNYACLEETNNYRSDNMTPIRRYYSFEEVKMTGLYFGMHVNHLNDTRVITNIISCRTSRHKIHRIKRTVDHDVSNV